jgi:hypothetical protein
MATETLRFHPSVEIATPVGHHPRSWITALERTRWVYRSSTMAGLSFRFALRSTDAGLGPRVEALLSTLRSPVPAAHWYSIVIRRRSGIEVFLDGSPLMTGADEDEALEGLLRDLDRSVAAFSAEHLLVRAAALEARERAVMFAGRPGCGKSTLAAALVASGLRYLSDDLVAIERDDVLLACPRPFEVDERGLDALSNTEPFADAAARRAVEEAAGARSVYLRPEDLRSGAVGAPCEGRAIVFPHYRRGVANCLELVSDDSALAELTANSLSLHRHEAAGMARLAATVNRSDCYRLSFSDLDAACGRVMGLVGESHVAA